MRVPRPSDDVERSMDEQKELYSLWRLFTKTRQAIWKASSKELARYGITPEQAGVLCILNNVLPTASQSEIARLMLFEHHTISGIIQRMEAKGLVKREVDEQRRNVYRASITDKGRETYAHALGRRSVQNVMLSVSKEERQVMTDILNKMLSSALVELEQYYTSPFSETVPDEI